MQLSQEAIDELRSILEVDIGKDLSDSLADTELQEFGEFLLILAANELKRRARKRKQAE